MVFCRKTKQFVGKALCFAFLFNALVPTLFAVERSMFQEHNAEYEAEYMDSQEGGLEALFHQIVERAIACDSSLVPSDAFVRCYQRIEKGYKTLLVEDVLNAMPELLHYALQQYEQALNRREEEPVTRSVRSARPSPSDDWGYADEPMKAPRPGAQSQLGPGAVVGPILVNPDALDSECGITQGQTAQILKLLKIIKNRIGTVKDDVCWDTVLGILGDACEKFGPDSNISCKLLEICEKIENHDRKICNKLEILDCKLGVFSCCPDINCEQCDRGGEVKRNMVNGDCESPPFCTVSDGLSEIFCEICEHDKRVCQKFEFTWSLIEDLKITVTECCEEIIDTVTECCDELKNEIIETRSTIVDVVVTVSELMCDKFEVTWSLIEDLSDTVTECCDDIINTVSVCCQDIIDTVTECCQEVIATVTECCDDLADDIFDTQTILCKKIEDVKETLTECCKDILDEIEETFSILCDKIESISFQTDFSEVLSVLADIKETLTGCCDELLQEEIETRTTLCDKLIDLEETLTECCQDLADDIFDTQTIMCAKFDETFSQLQNLEILIEILTDTTINNFLKTFSLLNEISMDVLENMTLIFEFSETIRETLSELEDILCGKFRSTWTLIADLKETLTECCDDLGNEIIDTRTILCKKIEDLDFSVTVTVDFDLSSVFTTLADLKATLTECCGDLANDIANSQTTIVDTVVTVSEILCTKLVDLKLTLTECCDDLSSEIIDTRTILCKKIEDLDLSVTVTVDIDLTSVFTTLADLKTTLTECCDDLSNDIFDTQTIMCAKFDETFSQLQNLEILIEVLTDTTIENFITTISILNDISMDVVENMSLIFQLSVTIRETLSELEEILCGKFDTTWTLIADLKETLTECCDDLSNEIIDTRTILCKKIEDLDFSVTVTVDFDLSSVFTTLADLKATLTECCYDLANDIANSQTTIVDTVVTVSEVLCTKLVDLKATLTECCDDLSNDIFDTQTIMCAKFDETFSQLQNLEILIEVLTDTTIENFITTISILNDISMNVVENMSLIFQLSVTIRETLSELEEILCGKFDTTWTLITDLKETLTECCDDLSNEIIDTRTILCKKIEDLDLSVTVTINIDLSSVFTTLADLKATLTECCGDLANDIVNSQTTIVDAVVTVSEILCTKLVDLKLTLTECCDDLSNEIIDTRTILCKKIEDLEFTTTVDLTEVTSVLGQLCTNLTLTDFVNLGTTTETRMNAINNDKETVVEWLKKTYALIRSIHNRIFCTGNGVHFEMGEI